MPNPHIIMDASKRPPEGPAGNKQVDGTTVHSNELAAGRAELQAGLEAMDRASPSGAFVRTPKTRMIDTIGFDKANPRYHHRYVSTKDPDRMASRIEDGYKEVPRPKAGEQDASAYGRRLGDELVLMRQPIELHVQREAEIRSATSARERAHVQNVSEVAQQVIAELQRQGIKQDPARPLFFNEAK